MHGDKSRSRQGSCRVVRGGYRASLVRGKAPAGFWACAACVSLTLIPTPGRPGEGGMSGTPRPYEEACSGIVRQGDPATPTLADPAAATPHREYSWVALVHHANLTGDDVSGLTLTLTLTLILILNLTLTLTLTSLAMMCQA